MSSTPTPATHAIITHLIGTTAREISACLALVLTERIEAFCCDRRDDSKRTGRCYQTNKLVPPAVVITHTHSLLSTIPSLISSMEIFTSDLLIPALITAGCCTGRSAFNATLLAFFSFLFDNLLSICNKYVEPALLGFEIISTAPATRKLVNTTDKIGVLYEVLLATIKRSDYSKLYLDKFTQIFEEYKDNQFGSSKESGSTRSFWVADNNSFILSINNDIPVILPLRSRTTNPDELKIMPPNEAQRWRVSNSVRVESGDTLTPNSRASYYPPPPHEHQHQHQPHRTVGDFEEWRKVEVSRLYNLRNVQNTLYGNYSGMRPPQPPLPYHDYSNSNMNNNGHSDMNDNQRLPPSNPNAPPTASPFLPTPPHFRGSGGYDYGGSGRYDYGESGGYEYQCMGLQDQGQGGQGQLTQNVSDQAPRLPHPDYSGFRQNFDTAENFQQQQQQQLPPHLQQHHLHPSMALPNQSNSKSNEEFDDPPRPPKRQKQQSNDDTGRGFRWTLDEDNALKEVRENNPNVGWPEIQYKLITFYPHINKNTKQCRERYKNHLQAGINKGEWSLEEDKILFDKQHAIGNKWAEISQTLHGRTEMTVKNRFFVIKNRLDKRQMPVTYEGYLMLLVEKGFRGAGVDSAVARNSSSVSGQPHGGDEQQHE